MTYDASQLMPSPSAEYFAPAVGLIYILVKIALRHIIHKAIDHNYDVWGVMSWFSVDITLLSLSVSIASNAPTRQGYDREWIIFWYLAFGFCFIIAAFCYLFFVKHKDKLDKGKKSKKDKIQPYKDLRLSIYMSIGWLIGFAWFWATLRALR